MKRELRGGLSFNGQGQRPLFVSESAAPYEHDEQASLFQWITVTARMQSDLHLREALGWIHSVPNGAHVQPAQARKLIAEGMKSGILDISTDEPRQGYHGLRVEMKRKGRKPSPEQLRYMDYLSRINVRNELCYRWQDAARIFVEYFGLLAYAPIPDR